MAKKAQAASSSNGTEPKGRRRRAIITEPGPEPPEVQVKGNTSTKSAGNGKPSMTPAQAKREARIRYAEEMGQLTRNSGRPIAQNYAGEGLPDYSLADLYRRIKRDGVVGGTSL
jgi:hypothetical protein